MPWRMAEGLRIRSGATLQMYCLAEINRPYRMLQVSSMGGAFSASYASAAGVLLPGLSLMVWILKREVRAFGGCLGMYRR